MENKVYLIIYSLFYGNEFLREKLGFMNGLER